MPWYFTEAADPFARVMYSRADSLTIIASWSKKILALFTMIFNNDHASEGDFTRITMTEIESSLSTVIFSAF